MVSDVAGERADALLAELELAEGAEREAAIVLAGVALTLADGDPEAAREPLTEVLTAIGAIGYEPGAETSMWGVRKQIRNAATEGEDQ